ncbi:MAG: hypothetical protein JNJ73_03130 [Hyphomonadaceae bacterium]|nr:hypothetical protein [Hyphomonadaceae bacterium]
MRRRRRLLLIAAFAFAAPAPAYGERDDGPTDGRFEADYDRRPTGEDFARHYPAGPLDESRGGSAVLCCTPRADRTLDCRVGAEAPNGDGFGAAAVAISRSFRLTRRSYEGFMADPSNWMQVPIHFRVEPGTTIDIDAFRRLTQGLCRPAATPVS